MIYEIKIQDAITEQVHDYLESLLKDEDKIEGTGELIHDLMYNAKASSYMPNRIMWIGLKLSERNITFSISSTEDDDTMEVIEKAMFDRERFIIRINGFKDQQEIAFSLNDVKGFSGLSETEKENVFYKYTEQARVCRLKHITQSIPDEISYMI